MRGHVVRRAALVRRVLKHQVVRHKRDSSATARARRPVGRANERVAQHRVLAHIPRANIAHARGADLGRYDGQRLADDRHGRVRRVRDDREARGAGRERLRARRPYDRADEAAGGAVLDLDVLNLGNAAVDAQRRKSIVDRVAVRVRGRQALGALQRDGAWVLLQVLGLSGTVELLAVLDEEVVKANVKVRERLPNRLVHLEAQRKLVLGQDVVKRRRLKGRAHEAGLERLVARGNQTKARARIRTRVDEADLVTGLGHLEANRRLPVLRQHREGREPRHFFRRRFFRWSDSDDSIVRQLTSEVEAGEKVSEWSG